MPTPEDVSRAFSEGGARAILLASPSNPTGAMLPAVDLARLVDATLGWFISDEIYHGLTYSGPAATALSFSQKAIVINSFSKYYSMTGWRIGWMVVPEVLARVFERLAQNLYIAPPTISQVGALAAFDAVEELEAYKAVYAQNRAMLLEELPRAGFDKLAPADGAFYLYADVGTLTDDSESFVQRILKETGVAVTPGIDFDEEEAAPFRPVQLCGAICGYVGGGAPSSSMDETVINASLAQGFLQDPAEVFVTHPFGRSRTGNCSPRRLQAYRSYSREKTNRPHTCRDC